MSWRFVAVTATFLVVFGFSGMVGAQDDLTPGKEKADSKTAGSADQGTASAETAPDATKTPEKAASANSKTPASKTKTKKSSARSKSRTSTGSSTAEPKYELATFGGGCFWHVESDFERLNGVISAVSGYAGGAVRNPNYEMVHEGLTGHAEVVMVQYDADIISYEDLLKVFWQIHDPTTPNRQGPDVGTQYRSIILYHNEAQRKAALDSYHKLVEARAFRNPIVTQLVPLKAFYRAEDEHQDYYGGKPRASSRRKSTSASRAKKPQSKVAKALAAKPADEAKPTDEAKPADGEKLSETKSAETPPASDKDVEKKP